MQGSLMQKRAAGAAPALRRLGDSIHPLVIARPSRASSVRTLATAATAPASSPSASSSSQPHGRVYNFAAGPAVLPLDVLEQAQADLVNWQGSGMSVMEMSHRGKEFDGIAVRAEADLRALLRVPDNYKIVFVQGGASSQFAAVPLNLAASEDTTVDYIITGAWSKKAASEAGKFAKVNVAAKGDNKSIPPQSSWKLSASPAYVHYCDNETIGGVEFQAPPEVPAGVPLVADMSSNFISRPVDVSKFGVIYAGCQKNVGPAGTTIVIVREDLLGKARAITPTMLDFKTHTDNNSMYNTPPCWSLYICGLVFAKLLREGGLEVVQARNQAKAKVLYDAIESSKGFYSSPVDPAVRSLMNVPFTIPSNADLEKSFVKEAEKIGLVQLKGHRSVGGMRASIYNAMPPEGVQKLADFMADFAARNSA